MTSFFLNFQRPIIFDFTIFFHRGNSKPNNERKRKPGPASATTTTTTKPATTSSNNVFRVKNLENILELKEEENLTLEENIVDVVVKKDPEQEELLGAPLQTNHSELKFRKNSIFAGKKTHFFDIFKSTKTHILTFSKVQKHIF